MGLRAKSVNTLSNKILFTLKIKKYIFILIKKSITNKKVFL